MSEHERPENAVLSRIVSDYCQALERGEKPDRDHLLESYPELAEQLRDCFTNRDQIQTLAADSSTLPLQRVGEDATVPRALEEDRTLARDGQGEQSLETNVRFFGDYELLEEIARGGMGVVYKTRQSGLNRIVALKMILSGQLAGEEDVQRFHAEAEAAANLDHPGIVPIYEIGEHDGQHYFSMGFVDGESLADKINDGPLPPHVAAEYTRKIAEAISFAHEHGVIHRDLKPGNVLIDRNNEVKVTDFGLAKKVEGDSGLTATGQILGTPSYMPPEQAAGKTENVDTRADVYSLGAILYALLTGRPPFQGASPLDTLMQVLEQEPVFPRQLNQQVPQDLETICLKCLEKVPHHRYPSAEELSRELQRFRNGEPIVARPLAPPARIWRWCRRKPIVASLLAATAGSLLVGILVSSFFAVLAANRADEAISAKDAAERALKAESQAKSRAETALAAETLAKSQARRAVDNYVDLVTTDAALSERRFQPLRRRLLSDALNYYQWLSDTSREKQSSQLDLALACKELGRVHLSSGSAEQGYEAVQEAVRILRGEAGKAPAAGDVHQHLSGALDLLARLSMELSRTSETVELYAEAIRIDQSLVDRFPNNDDYKFDLAGSHNNLGEAHRRMGNTLAAAACYQDAIEIKQQLVDANPDNARILRSLGNSHNNLGILRISDRDRHQALREAIRIRELLVQREPANSEYQDDLASSYFNLGNLRKQPSDKLESYDKARAIHERLLREDPNVLQYRFSLAKDFLNSGEVCISLENLSRAEEHLTDSIQLHQQLIAERPEVPEYRHSLAQCHETQAMLWVAREDYENALDELQATITILLELAQSYPDRTRYQSTLAFAYYRAGDLLYNQVQDPEAALEFWRKEVALRETLAKVHPDQPSHSSFLGGSLNNVAMVLENQGEILEAARTYDQAAKHQAKAVDANPQDTQALRFLTNHLLGLGRTRRELGHWSQAVNAAKDFIELWPDDADGLYVGAAELARCLQMAKAVGDDPERAVEEKEIEAITSLVLQTLEAAIAAGLKDVQQLDQDDPWGTLRNDEQFLKFLNQLAPENKPPGTS